MRWSDEEYEVGDIFINVETKERFVCVEILHCGDSYYDKIYVISEEEYVQYRGSTICEESLSTFDIIHGCMMDDYEWVKSKEYEPKIVCSYYLG